MRLTNFDLIQQLPERGATVLDSLRIMGGVVVGSVGATVAEQGTPGDMIVGVPTATVGLIMAAKGLDHIFQRTNILGPSHRE